MKNTYGVCLGMLAMGLAIMGAPAVRAQSRVAASGESSASSESKTSAAVAPAASSPADLDRRIEALETELVALRSEMAARKETQDAAAATPAAAPAAAPQDKPTEKTTIASLLGPTSVSGFVDTYYQANFNHPVDRGVDFRAFDFRSQQISLNMIELILDKAPDASGPAGRTGYHVSLGFGDGMNVVNAADPAGFAQYLKEGYFSYLAPIGKGLQLDIGKYVTPMGSEVIESKDNWNYSRGLLFTYAIPFDHFGARAKYTFNDKYSVTGYFANGWNNIVDNNSGKMYGMTFSWNPTKKVSFAQTLMAGPETSGSGVFGQDSSGKILNVNDIWRQTWDTVVTYNPTSKISFMANFDYGRGDRTFAPNPSELTPAPLNPPVYWTGGAGYAKYAIDANDYVAGRYEYFEDHDGFMTGTPARTHFHEFTATYQRTIATHLLTRLEYRRDMANQPVYDIGTFPTGIKYQNTVSLGLIFLFDSREAK
jgi:hypothetical protein